MDSGPPVPLLSSRPKVFIEVSRERRVHCVRSVQVFLSIAFPDCEDLFPVCSAGARELSEDPPSSAESVDVFPSCGVAVNACAVVSL